jgi:SAM-dependent methyltransferase
MRFGRVCCFRALTPRSRRSRRAQALPGLAVRLLWRVPAYRRYLARLFASAPALAAESAFFGPRKHALFARLEALGLDPDVVDIGAGPGTNVKYLPPNVKRLTTVEPNAATFADARAAAAAAGVKMTQLKGYAERLPLEDGCMDCVIETHTLCSVRDVGAALREVSRVLRPGGLFIFFDHEAARREHGGAAAPSALTRALGGWRLPPWLQQRLFSPPWQLMSGGCQLTRPTGALIEAAAKKGKLFDESLLSLEHFELPPNANCFPGMWLVAPHVAGVAVKPGGPAAARAQRGAEREAAAAAQQARKQRQAEAEGQAVPMGQPAERFATEVEKQTEEKEKETETETKPAQEEQIEAAKARKTQAELEEEGAGGLMGGGAALVAAEVAVGVAAAAAAAAATLTAASHPALMRRAYKHAE